VDNTDTDDEIGDVLFLRLCIIGEGIADIGFCCCLRILQVVALCPISLHSEQRRPVVCSCKYYLIYADNMYLCDADYLYFLEAKLFDI
jgi:hypothetical protein